MSCLIWTLYQTGCQITWKPFWYSRFTLREPYIYIYDTLKLSRVNQNPTHEDAAEFPLLTLVIILRVVNPIWDQGVSIPQPWNQSYALFTPTTSCETLGQTAELLGKKRISHPWTVLFTSQTFWPNFLAHSNSILWQTLSEELCLIPGNYWLQTRPMIWLVSCL